MSRSKFDPDRSVPMMKIGSFRISGSDLIELCGELGREA
jgi:hypothetical protein